MKASYTLFALIISACLLSACNDNEGNMPQNNTDAFTSHVKQIVATQPDNDKAMDAEQLRVNTSEHAEPLNL